MLHPRVISGLLLSFLATLCPQPLPAQDVTTETSGKISMENPISTSASSENSGSCLNISFLTDNTQRVVDESTREGNMPGGVVLVLRDGDIAFSQAYGDRAVEPSKEPATVDTIYDLASLTKPIATASSIMKLIEQGRIRLNDPIDKFIPEWKNTPEETTQSELLNKVEKAMDHGDIRSAPGAFVAKDPHAFVLEQAYKAFPNLLSTSRVAENFNLLPRDRESITIRHLLTHTSGLPSFVRFFEQYPDKAARKKIVADIAKIDLRGPVGGQFIYSDLGFMVLGDIVERVSGLTLDKFSQKEIFEPLKMNDTMFTPPDSLDPRIAPTEWRAEKNPADPDTTRTMMRGEVHDGNAMVQDGVSGHAGLFSSAPDLARFFTMMLNGGELDGVRIFSPTTIAAMTSTHERPSEVKAGRGLGWDLASAYSGQKGDLFAGGYGHTGFTGTSVWVVPEEKLAIIILTNHVHPKDNGSVVPLRARIANIVAGSITKSHIEMSPEIDK